MSVNAEDVLNDADLEAEGQDTEPGGDAGSDPIDNEPDYEAIAKDQGWDPTYDGPNKKSAKQFVEDGEKIQPILQANLRKERQRVEALEARLQETEENTKRSLSAMQKHFERETQRQIAEIQAKKKQAVKNADEEAFEKLEAEEKELLKAKPEEESETKDFRADPVVQQWEKDNSWYGADEELTDFADFYSQRLRKKTDKTGKDFLELVGEQVRKQFPDKFKNPRKQNFTAAAPSTRSQPTKTTSFDSLPPSAKRNFDYAVTRGLIKDTPESRQQYAKDFSEEE